MSQLRKGGLEFLMGGTTPIEIGSDSRPGRSAAGRPALGRRPLWSWLARLTLILALALAPPGASLAAQAPSEYQVKAAFLFNFAKFIEWPPETFTPGNAPLILGVLGDDPFGDIIDQTISGKTVNGRQLVVKRLKWGQNLKECQILFISASERKRLPQICEMLKGASVLTVSEVEKFAQQGGIINLVMEENKVRFDINTNVAEQARLKISSKLLALAKSIIGEHRAGRN
ncbi:MAG TPA: YfiR family protein [Blastocatellia bacterium]|nr:YfiR family protein [Blastocatellia bacterium]